MMEDETDKAESQDSIQHRGTRHGTKQEQRTIKKSVVVVSAYSFNAQRGGRGERLTAADVGIQSAQRKGHH